MQLIKTFFLTLIFCQCSYAQLNDFILNVASTNESCLGNGTLLFTVSNTTPGATILYTVYKLPDILLPVSVQSTTSLGGLTAGDYRIVATQSLASLSSSQQQDIEVLNTQTALTYTFVNAQVFCGNDGKITVNVQSGTPVLYEIFDGPILMPPQTSNIFSGLTVGTYKVRVFDSCGTGVVRTTTLFLIPHEITLQHQKIALFQCERIKVYDYVFGNIAYPLQVEYTVTPPSGPPVFFTQQYLLAVPEPMVQEIPFYYDQTYSYTIKVTDRCGTVYNSPPITVHPLMSALMNTDALSCDDFYLGILIAFGLPPFTVNFISMPVGFDPIVYNPNYPIWSTGAILFHNPDIVLPPGHYAAEITDSCGRQTVVEKDFFPQPPTYTLTVQQSPGCDIGYGSLWLYSSNGDIDHAEILSAPAAYPFSMPHNVDDKISFGDLYMGHLPPGSYHFRTIGLCNVIQEKIVYIEGYQIYEVSVNIIPHCNAFDLELHYYSNNYSGGFYLEKFNAITSQWETLLPSLINNTVNYNLYYNGSFRLKRTFQVYNDPNPRVVQCEELFYYFDFDGSPKINTAYSFACNDGTYNVILDATSIGPLIYTIVEKDNIPFLVTNGNSAFFSGLAPGHYKFEVEDTCGNIVASEVEVQNTFQFPITATGLCDGETALLTVPGFPFLDYQWWKNNDTGTILSSGNSLSMPNFNSAAAAGTYHVGVQYNGSVVNCVDFIIDYQISPVQIPDAGLDSIVFYCGNPSSIDLFTLLGSTFDVGGVWQELTASGTLVGNMWDTSSVVADTYQFKYTVMNNCGAADAALVEISIKAIPQTPVASTDAIACDTHALHLFASDISDAIYKWNGPNGFTSNLQNPIVDPAFTNHSGTYSVKVISNGCESEGAFIDVIVNLVPDFEMKTDCANSNSIISAEPLNASFDSQSVNYLWEGPDGYISTQNLAVITGKQQGQYSLTITTSEGCSTTKSITVLNTVCATKPIIPTYITANGDSMNETFNLSELDVVKLEIYSRWGRLVYDRNNYIDGWNGQTNSGHYLPASTYFYLIKLKSGETIQGWIYLMR